MRMAGSREPRTNQQMHGKHPELNGGENRTQNDFFNLFFKGIDWNDSMPRLTKLT